MFCSSSDRISQTDREPPALQTEALSRIKTQSDFVGFIVCDGATWSPKKHGGKIFEKK